MYTFYSFCSTPTNHTWHQLTPKHSNLLLFPLKFLSMKPIIISILFKNLSIILKFSQNLSLQTPLAPQTQTGLLDSATVSKIENLKKHTFSHLIKQNQEFFTQNIQNNTTKITKPNIFPNKFTFSRVHTQSTPKHPRHPIINTQKRGGIQVVFRY